MPVDLSPAAALTIKLAAISISYCFMSISALPTTDDRRGGLFARFQKQILRLSPQDDIAHQTL